MLKDELARDLTYSGQQLLRQKPITIIDFSDVDSSVGLMSVKLIVKFGQDMVKTSV